MNRPGRIPLAIDVDVVELEVYKIGRQEVGTMRFVVDEHVPKQQSMIQQVFS